MLSKIKPYKLAQLLNDQLQDEIIALYLRPAPPTEPDEYLLIVEESSILGVQSWSELFQRCSTQARLQLLSQREFLFQLSRSRLELIGWCLQGQWLCGRPVLQHYHVQLEKVGEQLEQALIQEQIRFRQAWLSAPTQTYRHLLQEAWRSFEKGLIPGLLCLSGLEFQAPELDLRLAEAFSFPDEQILAHMRHLEQLTVAELPGCAVSWETLLWHALTATERFTDQLAQQERCLLATHAAHQPLPAAETR